MIADLLIRNAAELFTCAGPAPRTGRAMREAGRITDAALAAHDGRIVFVGPTAECDWLISPAPIATVIDATGCAVVPGFVDAHTHVVFAGDRRDELSAPAGWRDLRGDRAEGGGILSTVRATRAATVDQLVDATAARLDEMLRAGTTTAEAKSGYGLTLESELTMLRAIRRLDQEHPIDLDADLHGRARSARRVPRPSRGVRRADHQRHDSRGGARRAGGVVRRVL